MPYFFSLCSFKICIILSTSFVMLQFLFIEGAEVPQMMGTKPFKVKESIKPASTMSRSYISPASLISNSSLNYNNGNSTLILYDSTSQSAGGNYVPDYYLCLERYFYPAWKNPFSLVGHVPTYLQRIFFFKREALNIPKKQR